MKVKSPYGSRGQIAALVRGLEDVQGNKDGIPKNEHQPAGWTSKKGWANRQAMLNRLTTAFEPGLSTADEEKRLADFVKAKEKAWGAKVTTLSKDAVPHFEAFRAEKAIALARFDRKPQEVTEGFVQAKGSVDGQPIEARDIFWQRWKPIGKPSGQVYVVSPGFQETGRNFYEQIQLLNQQGHDVIVMDHQWAGYSQGKKGGIDRGFGVARDVAAVAAMAEQVAAKEYGRRPQQIVLFGNSMGGGPGAIGAWVLNAAGKIRLDGPQMPKDVSVIAQAPFLEMTGSVLNKSLGAVGKVPGVKDLPLPSAGVPVLTTDQAAAAKLAHHVALEDITARPQAMNASAEDLATIQKLLDQGVRPDGRLYVIHGDADPLANPKAAQALVKKLGGQAKLALIPSKNHVLEESPTEQRHLLDAAKWLHGR